MTVVAYSQDILPVQKRLNRDQITGISLTTGASVTYDVECSATNWLEVQGDLASSTSSDLTISVTPFEEDGVTLTPLSVPVDTSTGAAMGPTASGGHTYYAARFNVTGIARVRITWTNNNAGTKALTRGSWRAEDYKGH